MALLLSLLLLCLSFYWVSLHPQCLDSQPPFKPDARYMWCRAYSQLGCCTKRDDQKLNTLYNNALNKVKPRDRRECARYLSKVICLECHSWSAHIFDAEANPNYDVDSSLPCLTWKFCRNLVKKCAPSLEFVYGDKMKMRNITLREFCRESEVTLNKDLCYPKIKKTVRALKTLKPGNIAYGTVASKKGCLCVREVGELYSQIFLEGVYLIS